MFCKDVKDFCEYYAISINKFLQDNFDMFYVEEKVNKKNKRWRIKHSEIENLPRVVPVSLKFAMYYEEFVESGKIIIVRDEFGKYQAYINPQVIIYLNKKEFLEQKKEEVEKTTYNLCDLKQAYDYKNNIDNKLDLIEQDERIIKYFSGEDAIEYSKSIYEIEKENNETYVRKLKKIDDKSAK